MGETLVGLQRIEPWGEASSNHPLVNSSIEVLKRYQSEYMESLESSVEVIDDGRKICSDALTLIAGLPAKGLNNDELHKFVEAMKKLVESAQAKAENARVKAEAARGKFIDVREGFNSVSLKMEGDIQQLEQEKIESEQAHERAVKKKGRVSTAVNIYRFINLPAKLPIFDPLFQTAEDAMTRGVRKEISKREQEMNTYAQALDTLKNVTAFTTNLIEQVDAFITWWSKMSFTLNSVGTSVDSLRSATSVNRMRMKHVSDAWKKCEQSYGEAKEKLDLLKKSNNRT